MSQNKYNISITDNAAKRINFLTSQEEDKGKKLRVSVIGGGCSGFQYKYELVSESEKDDTIIQKAGATALIDQVSADMVKNCTIDYVETLGFEHFQITNPKAASRCGCGNSFSI